MRVRMKRASVCLISLIVALFSLSSFATNNRLTIHFDVLFPRTPFTVILNTCMKVQGDINSLSDTPLLVPDFDLLNDLIVGRLFHIRVCIETMKHQEQTVHPEDIVYLMALLENMLASYKNICINNSVKTKKSGYIVNLIRDIQLRLEE